MRPLVNKKINLKRLQTQAFVGIFDSLERRRVEGYVKKSIATDFQFLWNARNAIRQEQREEVYEKTRKTFRA